MEEEGGAIGDGGGWRGEGGEWGAEFAEGVWAGVDFEETEPGAGGARLDGIIGGGIDLEEALFAVPVVVFGEIDPGWGGFEGDIGVETAVDEGVVADDEAGGGEGAEGVDGGIFAGGEVEGGIEESGMFFGEEMGIDARGVDAGEGGGAIGGEGEGACGADFWNQ